VSADTDLLADLTRIREDGLRDIEAAADAAALEAARVRHLARKAPLSTILRGLGELSPDQRATVGQAANETRRALEAAVAARQGALGDAAPAAGEDPTLPGVRPPRGSPHLVSQTESRILEIFRGMGFSVARGREVEDDYHNFGALNIPEGHPARDAHDTFFASKNILLRTHTSPVQIRVMQSTPPPVRMAFPGRVFRNESEDATHASEFHQVEILYVDRGVTLKDLKGTLTAFAHALLGDALGVRFRPSYFPFVEPGAELDIECFQCRGAGCRLCKESGWIEILGSGMVHTQVLREVGYDPEVVSGYAAGIGVERIAMLRHGIPDVRLFLENDLRFLTQFA
jgi:phenylalanyl-tRNA synthetase alpha chain